MDKICDRFEEVIWAFLDGDMSERHRIFWEEHLKSCDRCQSVRDEARVLVFAYQELPEHDAPETLLREILDQARSANPIKRAWRYCKKRLPGRRVWQSSLIGAVVVLGGILLVSAFRHRRSV